MNDTEGSGKPIRVLWAIKGLGPGGAEMLLASMASVHDPNVVAYECAYLLPWKDHMVARMEADGVRTHCLNAGRAWDLRWVLRLRRLIRQNQFDVVHFHSPYVAAFGRLIVATLPKRHRPAVVTTEHNVWWSFAWPTRLLNALTMPLDDARAAVSDDVRQSMWPGWRRRTHTVIHGVVPDTVTAQHDHRDRIRAELGFTPDQTVCCTVANYRHQKDYPNLLEAARLVLDRRDDIRFVAVGQGPLEAEIKDQHSRNNLEEGMVLTGYREDAVAVMAAADIFVLSSLHEGLPVAMMEALTLGLPVVSTAVGGIPAAVEGSPAATLVPPSDPHALADAIETTADAPNLDDRRGAARALGQHYDIRTAEQTFTRIYRRLAKKGRN